MRRERGAAALAEWQAQRPSWSMLLDHFAAATPADELVGVAIRELSEPSSRDSRTRRLGQHRWVPADELCHVGEAWDDVCTPRLFERWHWVHNMRGGPDCCANGGHLHGQRLPGVPVLRLGTFTAEPRDDGRHELSGVLGLPIRLDRTGDDRPTIADGRSFLEQFAPSVVLDTGQALTAVWLFDRPVAPRTARHLGRDLGAAIRGAAQCEPWRGLGPQQPPGGWLKVPGCVDLFRRHVTRELVVRDLWTFEQLRTVVPRQTRAARARR
jgi:hypothetical protein